MRVLVAAFVSVIALLGLAPGSAAAENSVESSSPENATSRAESPDEIIIVFNEALGESNTIALDCGNPITLPTPEVVDGTTLRVDIDPPLPAGTCVARWAVSNADDEPNGQGNISFIVESDTPATGDTTVGGSAVDSETVGDTAAAGDSADTSPATIPAPTGAGEDGEPTVATGTDPVVVDLSVAGRGDAAVWLGRLISTLGIATLFGSLLVITAAWPEGVEYLVTIKFLRIVWVVSMVGTLLFISFAAAAVTPDGGGGPFSPGTWLDLLDAGWAGRAALLRLVLLISSAWVAFRPDRAIDPTTQLAALGIPALAAATLGVSRTIGDWAALGVLMGVLHAVAVSIWVGGVILLARVVLAGPGDEDLIHAVRGFGRISTPAIVVTIFTGFVQMIRLDGGDLFTSGHGRIVVLKTVVVAVMIFVAFSARQFVAQKLNRSQQMSAALAYRLRRAFGAEAAFGLVALALSSWLLAWIPPNVDAVPSVDYEVSQTHMDAAELIDVELKFTDDTVGNVGMLVEVREPVEGLIGLDVVLRAPDNPTLVGYRQPVVIDGPGFAVRDESVGFPLTVPGDWVVTVEANTASGAVTSEPQILPILNADGSAPATVVQAPAVNTVEVAVSDPPTSEA